jgi:hypothetical protein
MRLAFENTKEIVLNALCKNMTSRGPGEPNDVIINRNLKKGSLEDKAKFGPLFQSCAISSRLARLQRLFQPLFVSTETEILKYVSKAHFFSIVLTG